MIFNNQLPIIMIVGAGNIGKWHIQSISTLKFLCKIFVIDNNEKNLLYSKKFFNKNSINIKNVFFLKNIPQVDKTIDILIIATKSDNRANILSGVVKINTVKYLILEKIVSSNLKDLNKIKKAIIHNNIKEAYINCPRRIYPAYQVLKSRIKNQKVNMMVNGCNWNSSSNLIHFLDLFLFFNNTNQVDLLSCNFKKIFFLDNGFLKYSGSYSFLSDKNNLIVNDTKSNHLHSKILITLKTKNFFYSALEYKGKVLINSDKDKFIKKTFITPKQSFLTKIIVENLIENKKIKLVTFFNSLAENMLIVKIFKLFLIRNNINKNFYIT
jgi:hypothetical protein